MCNGSGRDLPLVLGENSLINVPGRDKMRDNDRTHVGKEEYWVEKRRRETRFAASEAVGGCNVVCDREVRRFKYTAVTVDHKAAMAWR